MYPWVNPEDLDRIMKRHGYRFHKLGPYHDRTDGEEDRIYVQGGKIFRLYGNRWDYRTFKLNGKHFDLTADLDILREEDQEKEMKELKKGVK